MKRVLIELTDLTLECLTEWCRQLNSILVLDNNRIRQILDPKYPDPVEMCIRSCPNKYINMLPVTVKLKTTCPSLQGFCEFQTGHFYTLMPVKRRERWEEIPMPPLS